MPLLSNDDLAAIRARCEELDHDPATCARSLIDREEDCLSDIPALLADTEECRKIMREAVDDLESGASIQAVVAMLKRALR